jgi:cyclic-di-AMP phosphodiesterase PgpH
MSGPTSIWKRARERAAQPALQRTLIWGSAVVTSLLLIGLTLLESRYFPLKELPKGSVARYTLRATHDAVFDLHETFRAEAEEVRQTYIPIYDWDENLPEDRLEPILLSALAEPISAWRYSSPLSDPEDGTDEASPDAQPAPRQDAARRSPDGGRRSPRDSGSTDAGFTLVAQGGGPVAERRREIESMVRGCFRLLETYYRDGVVGDNEFPHQKKSIRILYQGEYGQKPVADLHRFSSLRPALERRMAPLFFKVEPHVRAQVINYILQRLPPNVTYARENQRYIGDISQVTGVQVVLIRGGEILARRGQVIDTRGYHAIRASVSASTETSRVGGRVSRFLLVLSLMLLFVVATAEVAVGPFRTPRAHLVTFGGVLLLVIGGKLLLLYTPVSAVLVPQATLALILAVVLGRAPALLAGLAVASCFLLTQTFELTELLVGVSGSVAAALAVRRRRRGTALAAGIVVGLVQALVFEATRSLEGRPRTYDELWSAGQAFLSGLLAGGFALVLLPFVEWLLGKSSRGKLRVLSDFDHPLLRELRERTPGTFAHTVTLTNMVELAVEAVGGERLLARVGTLFHDIGKVMNPACFAENLTPGGSGLARLALEERAKIVLGHVADGVALAKRHHLPADVIAFIAEHHGTLEIEELSAQVRNAGKEPDPSLFRYRGPKPQSIETAILMIANSVEQAARALPDADADVLRALVDRIVLRGLSEFQFDQCGITQGQLRQVKDAMASYLVDKLNRSARALSAS